MGKGIAQGVEGKIWEAGFQEYLLKPFDSAQLYQMLKNILAGTPVEAKMLSEKSQEQKNINMEEEWIDLSGLYDLIGDDKMEVKKFAEIVIHDYEDIQHRLLEAVKTNNLQLFREAKHNTVSTLHLLKANRLQSLLEQAHTRMETGTYLPNEEVFEALFLAVDSLLKKLRGL